jgi:hypothetical protein
MWKTPLSTVLCVIAAIACGEDLRTVDGTEYKQVTINRVEPDGVVITHSAGVAKIPFTELPKNVQERIGYETAKTEAAKAAERKRIEDQRAVERQRAEKEQSVAANLSKSEEQFEAAEKHAKETYEVSARGMLSGQVFVATKGGENFKLGAVHVALFSRDAIDILLAGVRAFADAKIEELQLAASKAAAEQADKAERQAETIEEQAKAAVAPAEAKEKSDWAYYQQSLASNEARHAAEAAKQAANAAKEALTVARRGVDVAKEAARVARQRYNGLVWRRAYYCSAAFYFGYLRSSIQTVETDGDGKFAMEIPRTGAFVIAAEGERIVSSENTERYHWLQPVSLEGGQKQVQNLSNSNLTRTKGTPSLLLAED